MIINLVKYWCQLNIDNSPLKTQLVSSFDVEGLPVQSDDVVNS